MINPAYPTMATTKTVYPMYADFIAAPASSMSSAAAKDLSTQTTAHNQITFEIPSANDLKHIDALHTFKSLLQRIGSMANTVAISSLPSPSLSVLSPLSSAAPASSSSSALSESASSASSSNQHDFSLANDAPVLPVQAITTEQIAKSVVLDLADWNDGNASNLLERLFAGSDLHAVINYLWIGVVSSLLVLSVIFILFSCYFYRKFREWKKCNKNIRTQFNANDLYITPASRALACEQRLLNSNSPALTATEAKFYQLESPPCYTIATGLPSYDEALHRQRRQLSFGTKFAYPTLAAVHCQPALAAGNVDTSSWEKQQLAWQQRKAAKQQNQLRGQLKWPPVSLDVPHTHSPHTHASAARVLLAGSGPTTVASSSAAASTAAAVVCRAAYEAMGDAKSHSTCCKCSRPACGAENLSASKLDFAAEEPCAVVIVA